jgi:hypothetical protein
MHADRLIDECLVSTTTTTSKTLTTTTMSTTTTTITTDVEFGFQCDGEESSRDARRTLVMPVGTACKTKTRTGAVDFLEELVR